MISHRLRRGAVSRPPRRTRGRWRHRIVGLFLLPVLFAVFSAAWGVLTRLPGSPIPFLPFLAGVFGYVAVQIVFRKPMSLYVFGHEATHALAALLSGYRVKSFWVSSRGGEVVLSGTNVWIALSPYCVPFYTLLVLGILTGVNHFWPGVLSPLWGSGAIGFTFSFHVALTVHALRQRQPDLRTVGPFLSLILIMMANGLVLILLLKILFPLSVSLHDYAARFLSDLSALLRGLIDFAVTMIPRGIGKVQRLLGSGGAA